MTKEDKELLLKDLCGRLPYGVKCKCEGTYGIENEYIGPLLDISLYRCVIGGKCKDILDVKPYLFPLSSMTEKQKNECFNGTPLEIDKYGDVAVKDDFFGNSLYTDLEIYLEVIDWLLKNHFDICGLIKKGLAIDCTNLNIY